MKKKKRNRNNSRSEAQPFVAAAIFWGVFSEVVCFFFFKTQPFLRTFLWTLGLWVVCVLDLAAMAQMFRAVFALMSDIPEVSRPAWKLRLLIWGLTKLTCLGLLGVILFLNPSIPSPALLFGLGTLVVVPLFGGLGWSVFR